MRLGPFKLLEDYWIEENRPQKGRETQGER